MTGIAITEEYVLHLLEEYGYLDTELARRAVRKAALRRKEMERDLERAGSRFGPIRLAVSAPEVVAGMRLPVKGGGPEETIDEDLVMELVARDRGLEYRKIDPLKLNHRFVTSLFSRPFARKHVAIPLEEQEQRLFVALADPTDLELTETVRRLTGKEVVPVLAAKSDIMKVITEFYGFRSSITAAEAQIDPGIDLFNLEQFINLKSIDEIEATDKHVINAVDYLFNYAIDQRASDIHIEPKREVSRIRIRIDGMLHTLYSIPKKVHQAFVNRIKTLSRLDIAERRKPQDGRLKSGMKDREVEFRVSTVPTAFGEKLVLRIFDSGALLTELENLGMDPEDLLRYRGALCHSNGIVLITGPTGSGKTTTLYSSLFELASPEVNILTIEDPIEMVIEEFNQMAVQPVIGLDFATALRHILRQDPDIVMVGEIRDRETAANAMQAALTGHLVLSTLHTNDSAGAVERMLDLGCEPFLLSSTLRGVVAQRLVRRICGKCRRPRALTEREMDGLGITQPAEGQEPLTVWDGVGCAACRQTGFFGRTGLFEILEINDRLAGIIAKKGSSEELRRAARREGLRTLQESAIHKLAKGITSATEIMRVLAP